MGFRISAHERFKTLNKFATIPNLNKKQDNLLQIINVLRVCVNKDEECDWPYDGDGRPTARNNCVLKDRQFFYSCIRYTIIQYYVFHNCMALPIYLCYNMQEGRSASLFIQIKQTVLWSHFGKVFKAVLSFLIVMFFVACPSDKWSFRDIRYHIFHISRLHTYAYINKKHW